MKYVLKAKTARKDMVELSVEVFCKDDDLVFSNEIRDVEGVEDITLIQYNGEYHG